MKLHIHGNMDDSCLFIESYEGFMGLDVVK